MATYEIHGPAMTGEGETARLALRATKSGFSWAAFLFAPLWLAARRLWLPLALYVAASAALVALANLAGLTAGGAFALALTASLFIGFEGRNWRRAALAQRGAPVIDIVEATDAEEAVERYARRAFPAIETPPPSAARETWPAPRRSEPQVLGLFPEARKP